MGFVYLICGIIIFLLILYIRSEYSYLFKKKISSFSIKSDLYKKDYKELDKNNLCILDLETTGFNPENSEIVEIFILKVKHNEIIDEFYSLFKPKQRIRNSDIHGITDNKVKSSPSIKEKNDEIFEFIENTTLVGHNLDNFDLKFLNYHLNSQVNNETLDTLKLSRKVLANKVANHKLNTLAEYFEIKPPTHSARDDVMTTYEVYKKLISIK